MHVRPCQCTGCAYHFRKAASVSIDHIVVVFVVLLQPKMIVTASFGIEPGRRVEYIPLVEKALELSSHKPDKVLIFNRPNMVRPCGLQALICSSMVCECECV